MSKSIDWLKLRQEVFKKENLITILVVGFFPPFVGAGRAIFGFDPLVEANFSLSKLGLGFLYSYIVTASLFYGSFTIIQVLNQLLPWKGNISKRVFLEALLVLSYTSLAQLIILWSMEGTAFFYIDRQLSFQDYLGSVFFSNTITIIVVAILEGIYFFREWRETVLAAERLQKENAESQLANLRAQLDPHFMFNSLNVLVGLIRQDPKKAESFVEDFARVYRHMLEVNNRMVVPLEEEISFSRQYLRLQQIRFDAGLKIDWQLSDGLKDRYLPPLSLQEVISNAIKHNIIDAKNPLHLSISTNSDHLVVRNNLNPRKGLVESTGTGQTNIKERYHLLQHSQANFHKDQEYYTAELPLLKLDE